MVVKSETNLPKISHQNEKSSMREALPQILAVCVKNVLLLGFGMTLGFPTILIPSLSGKHENEISLGPEAISWIGSINLICVPVGCLLSGAITQPIGRKRAMQMVNIPFLTAWLLFYFSKEAWHIFLALAITGLTGGLLEAPVLTYVAEITQPHLRGMLSSTSTMSVTLGVLCQFLLGTFLPFRSVALVNCLVPLLAFCLLIFVPETPIWLISKNRFEDAKKSMAWLRGWTTFENIQNEFEELCKQLGRSDSSNLNFAKQESQPILQKPKKMDTLKLLTKKTFIWPYLLVSFSFFLGHFNGMTPLQTYAIQIFSSLKSPIDKYYCTVLMGCVELLGCIGCVILVHVVGKRIINFISLIGCGLCFIIVATYAHNINIVQLENLKTNQNITISSANEDPEEFHWTPMIFLVLSAFLSHLGIRVLPWILTGEVFTNETRAIASGLSGGIGYILSFISNKIFFTLVTSFTLPGTFWFYGAVSFVGTIVLYFTLPETEGKTLYQITEHFSGKSKLNNQVQKRNFTGQENPGFHDDEYKNKVESKL